MLRLGLCCIFKKEPITFRQTTAKVLLSFSRDEQLQRLSELCSHNLHSLHQALEWLSENGIGAFRVLSPLFPRYTHPDVGYQLDMLPHSDQLFQLCRQIKVFGQTHDIRLSLHPDQFNVLSSPHQKVVENTVRELEYQGMLAELIGAEVINIHGGGAYGNKSAALERFSTNFKLLSPRVQERLCLENDDVTYSPADLLPLCHKLNIPFVYDVHHHRCLPDQLTLEEATAQCFGTWQARDQEPYFHISTPRNGWESGNSKPHADYIDPADFPPEWLELQATVDIEAKAKELAVLRLKKELFQP